MKLFIKNMVSTTCKRVVQLELEKLGLHCLEIKLGEVEVKEQISKIQYDTLGTALSKFGLELINDRKSVFIEKIKNIIVEFVYYSDQPIKTNFSDYLSEKLNYNYTFISNQFTELQGTSIRKHIMLHKIERVKELLTYDEYNITEIAYKLNYSSVAHLCNQFKKITGLTPSHFKQLKNKRRIPIEEIGN